MDPVEALLELYQQTQTSAERRVLLETVRISNPGDFARFEERVLQQQVRAFPHDRLIQTIASHRNVSPREAEERLRDIALQHLLDRTKLLSNLVGSLPSPRDAEQKSRGAVEPSVEVAILAEDRRSPRESHGVEPVPAQRSDAAAQREESVGISLPRLTPRGVAGS